MMKALMGSTLALVVVAGAASDAEAFTRKRTITGPYGGQTHFNSRVDCYGNTCTRSATRQGIYGRTITNNGSMTCGGGACTTSGVVTGRWGQTYHYSGAYTR